LTGSRTDKEHDPVTAQHPDSHLDRSTPTDLRVGRAKKMKADRDAAAQAYVDKIVRLRAEVQAEIDGGRLGRCPACNRHAPVVDGIVLEHVSDQSEGGGDIWCSGGPGEAPLPLVLEPVPNLMEHH
jgi:hypothetical protein